MGEIKFTLPPLKFFTAPFHAELASPPPSSTSPFYISPQLYEALLDIKVPVTLALVYSITVHTLNHYASNIRPPTPYAIAKTKAFYYFVVLHNLALAVYSGWTFVGMVSAVRQTIPSIKNQDGLAGTVHSLCKIHEDTGSGLWESGLSFYGWLFYLSKFYEVVDTAIILAKGRKSSTLQTYHHAGAMMCMWAGIRYMSPPIFLFVVFNSGIHTLMYTYYTLTTLHIRVPNVIKRSLTTLQISQFIIGGSFAAIHLFIAYLPPLSSLPAPVAAAQAAPSIWSKIAGYGSEKVEAATAGSQLLERKFVNCLSDSGEVYAILANVLYLTPLTYLFVMFFIRSYITNAKATTKREKNVVSPKKPAIGKTVAA